MCNYNCAKALEGLSMFMYREKEGNQSQSLVNFSRRGRISRVLNNGELERGRKKR